MWKLAVAFFCLPGRAESAALAGDAVAAPRVIPLAPWAVVIIPVSGVPVLLAVPVVTACIPGAKSDGHARRLNALATKGAKTNTPTNNSFFIGRPFLHMRAA